MADVLTIHISVRHFADDSLVRGKFKLIAIPLGATSIVVAKEIQRFAGSHVNIRMMIQYAVEPCRSGLIRANIDKIGQSTHCLVAAQEVI